MWQCICLARVISEHEIVRFFGVLTLFGTSKNKNRLSWTLLLMSPFFRCQLPVHLFTCKRTGSGCEVDATFENKTPVADVFGLGSALEKKFTRSTFQKSAEWRQALFLFFEPHDQSQHGGQSATVLFMSKYKEKYHILNWKYFQFSNNCNWKQSKYRHTVRRPAFSRVTEAAQNSSAKANSLLITHLYFIRITDHDKSNLESQSNLSGHTVKGA